MNTARINGAKPDGEARTPVGLTGFASTGVRDGPDPGRSTGKQD
jgi:hypothetical protein